MRSDKDRVRSEVLTSLKLLSDRELRSSTLVNQVVEALQESSSRVISCFVPLPEEPSLEGLLHRLRIQGSIIVVPEFEEHRPDGKIQFREWVEGAQLESVGSGWLHPVGGKLYTFQDLDAVLVPGVAYTQGGARLGRGGGFYDRLLSQSTATKIGLCFKEQLREELPVEDHDEYVDQVISC